MSERVNCPFAKSDMTPCVLKDGEVARADDGVCVGCERRIPRSEEREDMRRIQMQKWCEAERAIAEAVDLVERMGADVRLTDAVVLLGAAKDRVADFVDGINGHRTYPRQEPTPPQFAFAQSAAPPRAVEAVTPTATQEEQ